MFGLRMLNKNNTIEGSEVMVGGQLLCPTHIHFKENPHGNKFKIPKFNLDVLTPKLIAALLGL